MAGRPDPAFLNNVPTAFLATITSTNTSTSTSYSTSTPTTSSSTTTTVSSSTSPSTGAYTSTTSAIISLTTSSIDSSDVSNLPPSVYAYTPSTVLAVIFSVFYGALTPYHFYLSIYTPHIRKSVSQKHSYTIPLFVTCVLANIGFSIRILSVSPSHRQSILLYTLSQVCIIIAPIFACATLYLLIAHLVNLCLPPGKHRVFLGIGPEWLGRIFITSDVLSLLLQGAGTAIAASGDWQGPQRDTGTNLLIFGLAAQLGTFTFYLIILGLFCYRVQGGHESRDDQIPDKQDGETKRDFGFNPLVKQVVKGVWIASVLIEIRSVYRTVQFGMGVDGYLFRHEWTLWVFDATPIWLALLVLGIYHPTKWLQSKRRSWFVEKNARHTMQRSE